MATDCYVSYNGYDRAYEIVHEGHTEAQCPNIQVLQEELEELEREELEDSDYYMDDDN